MRLEEAVAQFIDSLNAAKKSEHTVAAYRRDLLLVGDLIASHKGVERTTLTLDDLTAGALRRGFGARAVESSVATMSRTHSSWRAFFAFLRAENLVGENPMEVIPRAKVGANAVRSIHVDGLIGKLLGAASRSRAKSAWPARDVAILALLSQAGLRLSELTGLTLGSRSGEPGAWQVTVIGKGRKARTIPLTDAVNGLVDRYVESRQERFPDLKTSDHKAPLFVDRRSGSALTARQVQYLVERVYTEAGVRSAIPDGALVHALRHTFAMDLLGHGADIVELQTLLGHASLNTTRRYLSAQPDHLRAAVAVSAASSAIEAFSADEESDEDGYSQDQ